MEHRHEQLFSTCRARETLPFIVWKPNKHFSILDILILSFFISFRYHLSVHSILHSSKKKKKKERKRKKNDIFS